MLQAICYYTILKLFLRFEKLSDHFQISTVDLSQTPCIAGLRTSVVVHRSLTVHFHHYRILSSCVIRRYTRQSIVGEDIGAPYRAYSCIWSKSNARISRDFRSATFEWKCIQTAAAVFSISACRKKNIHIYK